MTDRLNLMKIWREEEVYHDGDRFFSDLCHAVSGAKQCIHLETYIFDLDRLGNKILQFLSDAAQRGVQVRLLLDGVGCHHWSFRDLKRVRDMGIDAKFYHPLPWQNSSFRPFALRKVLLGLWKLNRRNHRKTCVIDKNTAFLGGLNISARHVKEEVGAKAWRDTSVRVKGEGVFHLVEAFDHAWRHPRSLKHRWRRYSRLSIQPTEVRLNLTRRQRNAAYADLVRRILRSQSRIWITNPYFIPDLSLLRALRFAAWAGVEVRLLLPKKSDIFGIKWAIRAFYFILLSAKVRIFEYGSSVLHAKSVLIDDWAIVGSSNLNHRSLLHDLEVDVVLRKTLSVRSISDQFIGDLKFSHEIESFKWQRRTWIEMSLERLALLFRRWL